jgi:DNA polymerase III delta prime subunit
VIDNADVYIEQFRTSQLQNKLSPCWILNGDPFIGKSHFARELSKKILYKNIYQEHGLPSSVIDKQVEEGIYPNFLYIEKPTLEDGTIAREISAEHAKTVKIFLQKKPAIIGWRVVVVDSINDLNKFGANSLLKILEEPPIKTLILLICHQLGTILPTIRSRCQILNLKGSSYFLKEKEDFVQVLTTLLDRYFNNDSTLILENELKKIIEMDKYLSIFFHVLLKKIHIWMTTEHLRPSYFNLYPLNHWVDVFKAINIFFNNSKNAHLDSFQILSLIFSQLKTPLKI